MLALHLGAWLVLDVLSLDHPRRAFAVLLGRNNASADLAKHRHGAQIKHPGRFSQCDFATRGPLAIHVDRNSVRVAKATHTRLRPSVQPAGSLSCSVEHTRNGLVGHQARACPDQVHHFRFNGPTRLTSPVLPHREAGVITALPMQEQLDLIIFYPRHDLTHHSADETLTRDGGRRRMMPSGLQGGTHLQQTLPFLGIQRRRSLSDQRLQLLLEHLHRREGSIPPPLELAGNKTIVRIDSVICRRALAASYRACSSASSSWRCFSPP